MKLFTHFITVIPLSKKIALLLFFLLPILTFILGMKYEDLSIIKNGCVVKKDVTSLPTPKLIKQQNELYIWKTYKSKLGKLSFEYPSSWKIEEPPIGKENGLFLKSPGGFEFHFNISSIQGGPYRCTTDKCPRVENYLIKPIKVNKNKTIYLVYGKFINIDGSSRMDVYASDNPQPNYAVVVGGGIWYDVLIKNNLTNEWNKPLYIMFYGGFPSKSYQQKLSAEEYFKLEDVRVADQIISSVVFE